ncbi:hypothetical protein BKA63DRAFT_301639 [Paraphoma chrysanthemicola]|nr:hypothetical protein BKA63DRAFT_301639 [Paraphoma chrysanthemicola]
MPSPHTASSPSKRQATQPAQHSSSAAFHHQTVYNGDRGHYIVDRRSMVARAANRSKSAHMSQPAPPSRHTIPAPSHRSIIASMDYHYSNGSPRKSPCLAPHVTIAKRSSKPEVVLHTAVAMTSDKLFDDGKVYKSYEELTPPPTPRLGRLPTPDIPDLEDRLFCECDSRANIVTYCTTCRRRAGPFPNLF